MEIYFLPILFLSRRKKNVKWVLGICCRLLSEDPYCVSVAARRFSPPHLITGTVFFPSNAKIIDSFVRLPSGKVLLWPGSNNVKEFCSGCKKKTDTASQYPVALN